MEYAAIGRWIIWAICICAFLYSAVVLIAYLNQRSFLYFPDTRRTTPAAVGLREFEEIKVASPSGDLVSWWRAPLSRDAPVVIAFHGNGGALGGRAELYSALAGEDMGLLAVGYPGYGGNQGAPSEAAFFKAAQTNYDWLVAKGFKPGRIVIFGQSIGTGVAIWLATQRRSAGLVLQSPYTSMVDMAARQMPYLPARLLLADRFDSLSRIDGLRVPIGWVHSRDDELIPLAMGKRLFDAIESRKCSRILASGGHNNMSTPEVADFVRRNAVSMVNGRQCHP
jgi:uncharacterized protein